MIPLVSSVPRLYQSKTTRTHAIICSEVTPSPSVAQACKPPLCTAIAGALRQNPARVHSQHEVGMSGARGAIPASRQGPERAQGQGGVNRASPSPPYKWRREREARRKPRHSEATCPPRQGQTGQSPALPLASSTLVDRTPHHPFLSQCHRGVYATQFISRGSCEYTRPPLWPATSSIFLFQPTTFFIRFWTVAPVIGYCIPDAKGWCSGIKAPKTLATFRCSFPRRIFCPIY